MALSAGTSIGSYQIRSQIGVGGMGEVYRATDTKLGRDVAIKVLPAALAGDAERLARLDREARTLAALSHPNIAAIYGLEDADGSKALVMELVEGPTLADRIAEGAIPVEEALPIARQIAEALEAAHEQGIVHRDLKPANVKVKPDGTVKVLDFGLAKAMDPANAQGASAEHGLSMSPTITTPAMTQAGIILGTAAYMSPEQARGKPVDRRTDIWAFGCVLYEMLIGTRPFHGEDVSLTMAAVMTATPDFARLPAGLPASLGTYLRRCLEKDPKQRVQSIGDVRLAIAGAFDAPTAPVTDPVALPPARLPWLIAVVAIAVAAVSLLRPSGGPDEAPGAVRRFVIDLGGLTLPRGLGTAVDISRDGQTVIFAAIDQGGARRVYRRALRDFDAAPIPGTDGGLRPFLSPDARWVAFSDESGVRHVRTPVSGGDAFTVCGSCDTGSWGLNGIVVASDGRRLSLVPDRGGAPQVLVEAMPERGISAVNNPILLPGERVVLFEIGRLEFGGVGLFSLDAQEFLVVTDNGSDPFYSPTGHLLFGQNGTLSAVPVDLDRFELTGPIVPVLPGVRIENGGAVQAALSNDGTLVYAPADEQVGTDLVWVGENGDVESVVEVGRRFRAPRIAPDGQAIAVQIVSEGSTDIWIHEAETPRPLTNSGNASAPLWSPDGRQIAYVARSDSSYALRAITVDGSEDEETLATSDVEIVPEAWLPDGRLLIREIRTTSSGLYLTDPEDASSRQPYLVPDYSVEAATLSPSGRWLAYVSNQTGGREVYVRPFPGSGREQLVSLPQDGGDIPSWGATDEVLFYASRSGERLMRASLQFEPIRVTERTQLFESNNHWTSIGRADYDVGPDSRLLMLRQRSSRGSQLRVVENWFTELLERVGN